MIKMFAKTGAKTTEVVELTWDEVDLNNCTIHLKARTKIQERTLKISNELIKILSMKKRVSNLVFQTYYKENFTDYKLARAINEFRQKGIYKGEWFPTDLRHSFAVNFLLVGGDIKELQRILGHSSIYETKKLYEEAGKKSS
jgi:integrase